MIIPKQLPEMGEIVLVKVKKIMPFGAYCTLPEYTDLEAYLPIKEVASGWIKNIHEFLKEGKTDAAKVIFVDREKHAIDISIKKVSSKEHKDKVNSYNTEKRYEALFKQVIASTKNEGSESQIKSEIAKRFATYTDLIDAIAADPSSISSISVDANFKEALVEAVKKNIKPKIYKVEYTVEISPQHAPKIDKIKEAFAEIEALGLKVSYLGAPHYLLTSEAQDYFKAEEKIRAAQEVLTKHFKSDGFTIKKEKD